MLQRIRLAIVAAATLAVAGLTLVPAAPAQAEASTGCSKISVSGDVTPDVDVDWEGNHTRGLLADLSGYAAAHCGSNYRFTVTLSSYHTGDVVIGSTRSLLLRNGSTSISFPDVFFAAPEGNGQMVLTIRSQVRNAAFGFWVNTGAEQTYPLYVPDDYFNTATMAQGSPSHCAVTPGWDTGKGAWC